MDDAKAREKSYTFDSLMKRVDLIARFIDTAVPDRTTSSAEATVGALFLLFVVNAKAMGYNLESVLGAVSEQWNETSLEPNVLSRIDAGTTIN